MDARRLLAFVLIGLAACTLLLLVVSTPQDSEVSLATPVGKLWGYNGSIGPKSWGGKCTTGRMQSPIDIPTTKAAYDYRLSELSWEFERGKKDPVVIFDGHTVKVSGNYATLKWADHGWKLTEFHFHTPSENKINNVGFPAEMQMVHRNAEGRLLVVSWMFDPDGWAPAYMPSLADHFPATFDGSAEYNHPVPGPNQVEFTEFINLILQRERQGHMFYNFKGSLTVPPCTENVEWIVMSELIGISDDDLKKLKKIEGKNSRPVQPLNGRKIFKSFPSD